MRNIILTAVMAVCCVFPALSKKIFLAGDSHVAGKIYPEKMGELLRENSPENEFAWWGKNGAGYYTYNDTPEYMDTIYDFAPDILVVHLGTNDCYTRGHFDEAKFTDDVDIFCHNVKENLPDCRIVFVTPFENKLRDKKNRKGRGPVNPHNRTCAADLSAYSHSHDDIFVIDNNADAGMMFLKGKNLIRPDKVHLTEKGYEILASQVTEKLLEIEPLWEE